MSMYQQVAKALGIAVLAGVLLAPPTALTATDKPAPTFTARDFTGQSVSLSDYEGKVVVLSFWANYCGPCKEEMPHLDKIYKDHKDEGAVVLSINTDDAKNLNVARAHIKRNRYSFPVVHDRDAKIVSAYNPGKSLPFTAVLNRDHTIVFEATSFTKGDEVHLEELVTELIAKPAE